MARHFLTVVQDSTLDEAASMTHVGLASRTVEENFVFVDVPARNL